MCIHTEAVLWEGEDAEELWCTEAVHLVPSLGHWDTVSSSMTFPNPNHVLCMSSAGALRDDTGIFIATSRVCVCAYAFFSLFSTFLRVETNMWGNRADVRL